MRAALSSQQLHTKNVFSANNVGCMQVFHLSIYAAASKLGTNLGHLKRSCRKLSIVRWPQRKLMPLFPLLQRALEEDDQVRGCSTRTHAPAHGVFISLSGGGHAPSIPRPTFGGRIIIIPVTPHHIIRPWSWTSRWARALLIRGPCRAGHLTNRCKPTSLTINQCSAKLRITYVQ